MLHLQKLNMALLIKLIVMLLRPGRLDILALAHLLLRRSIGVVNGLGLGQVIVVDIALIVAHKQLLPHHLRHMALLREIIVPWWELQTQ